MIPIEDLTGVTLAIEDTDEDDGDDGDDGDGVGDGGTELVLLPASLIRQGENNLHLGILSVPLSFHQKDLQRILPQKPFNDL